MSAEDLRSPWSELPELPPARKRAPLPSREARAAAQEQTAAVTSLDVPELTEDEYRVVAELRDRVSTRLTAEDKNYAAGARRELTKQLIRDEYDQWLLHEANRGRTAPTVTTEDRIFSAVLAELDGLGRLAPLLARSDTFPA